MKKIIPAGIIILIAFCCFYPIHKKTVLIKKMTDERGLTSIVYTEGKDTFAMDYLTKPELDSILTK